MSNELSRVKSRSKKKAGRTGARRAAAALEETRVHAAEAPAAAGTGTEPRSVVLSRKARGLPAAPVPRPEAAGDDPTPARTRTYPSERLKWSKRFVNALYVLFLALLVLLVAWGVKGAPDPVDLW